MYQILAYIKFLWKSKNHHGVHSPFVYQLITECVYDSVKYGAYKQLSAYRKKLIQNNDVITIEDFGAGSRTTSDNIRSIKSIANSAGASKNQAELIFRLTNYFKPNTILELGTCLGMSTFAMQLGNQKSKITTIEGSSKLSDLARKNSALNNSNINFLVGPFENHLPELKNFKWDMVFFDGNHTKTGTLNYFTQLIPTVRNDTVFIFDDIYWSRGMTEAWEEIKRHPKVTATVDLFYKGLVFFREEQSKEHFVIRM